MSSMDSNNPFAFSDDDVQGWRVRLAMICQSCPVYSKHPEFCHLHEVRNMKPGEQIDFINSLPVDALRYALARHEICMEVESEKSLKDALVSAC